MVDKNYKCTRSQSTIDSYSNVKCCDEWLIYSNFLKWIDTQDYIEKDLDKDLFGDGSLYSPETCCFIPHNINTMLVLQESSTGFHGVSEKGNRFLVKPYWDNKAIVGATKTFACPKEAHKYWQESKSNLIRRRADDEYTKGNIGANIRDALYRKADKILYERDNDLVTTKI
jgi:hypothetical protein